MAVAAPPWGRRGVSLERLEPAVPLFLGLHGLAIMLIDPGSAVLTAGFAGICVLGVAGLAGWTTTRAVVLRATATLGFALLVQLDDADLVPAMLQWYYCVAAVYSLLMTGWRAPSSGPSPRPATSSRCCSARRRSPSASPPSGPGCSPRWVWSCTSPAGPTGRPAPTRSAVGSRPRPRATG